VLGRFRQPGGRDPSWRTPRSERQASEREFRMRVADVRGVAPYHRRTTPRQSATASIASRK
jgi:hypothetical protein